MKKEYNKVCLECENGCKQFSFVQVIYCPLKVLIQKDRVKVVKGKKKA